MPGQNGWHLPITGESGAPELSYPRPTGAPALSLHNSWILNLPVTAGHSI